MTSPATRRTAEIYSSQHRMGPASMEAGSRGAEAWTRAKTAVGPFRPGRQSSDFVTVLRKLARASPSLVAAAGPPRGGWGNAPPSALTPPNSDPVAGQLSDPTIRIFGPRKPGATPDKGVPRQLDAERPNFRLVASKVGASAYFPVKMMRAQPSLRLAIAWSR